MIGIGGIGMAGLALLLKERGHCVTGCDEQENRQTAWLREKGISVLPGHDRSHLTDIDWIIRTTAVPDDHPEVIHATVPVSRRGEVLPALMRDRITIAVSGTHGKTTTTSMIAQILGCGYCIGGEVPGFDGVAKDGEIMVVEADESDGTIVNYHPDIAVITNIEYDHMEHHASVEAFESCFKTLIANTKQKVVYCAEDAAAARLCAGNPKAVSYGVAGGMWNVALPGIHNRLNASAAIEVSRQWKTDEEIFQALEKIKPVRRRFEKVFAGEYTIISDYAHHPTEIRTLIQTVRETLSPKRLLGIFQPHRYTRTKALMADFPPAFQGLDTLWLVPVYAASEKPLKGGTTEDLAGNFPAAGGPEVKNFHSLEKAWHDIKRELRAGDVLLIIGAGDIEQLAEWARR
jgi:UDP-N-acetylmuramate--alanine ligase